MPTITSTKQHEQTETGAAMAEPRVSAVVDRASQAVEQADARTTVPESDEVRAEANGGSTPEQRAATEAALAEGGVKPLTKAQKAKIAKEEAARIEALNDDSRRQGKSVSAAAKAAKPAADKPKYTPELKAAAKRAEELRGKARSCGPVQVQRTEAGLKAAKTDAAVIVKAFKSQKDAIAFAGGDKSVEQPEMVKQTSEHIDDPFARGRGLVSIALALAGK